jgi:hypothetical protein
MIGIPSLWMDKVFATLYTLIGVWIGFSTWKQPPLNFASVTMLVLLMLGYLIPGIGLLINQAWGRKTALGLNILMIGILGLIIVLTVYTERKAPGLMKMMVLPVFCWMFHLGGFIYFRRTLQPRSKEVV